jgi:hypothetical protein
MNNDNKATKLLKSENKFRIFSLQRAGLSEESSPVENISHSIEGIQQTVLRNVQ